jgi:hypothetical protein
MPTSRHKLKTIRFAGELLPHWAQLLDLAARMSPVPEETRHWFSLFTNRTGVDDASTVVGHCDTLRAGLSANREAVIGALESGSGDSDARTLVGAQLYSLDTMIQQASTAKTCAWHVEGTEDELASDYGDGDVSLRRI